MSGKFSYEASIEIDGKNVGIPVFAEGPAFDAFEAQMQYLTDNFYIRLEEGVSLSEDGIAQAIGASRLLEDIIRNSFSQTFGLSDDIWDLHAHAFNRVNDEIVDAKLEYVDVFNAVSGDNIGPDLLTTAGIETLKNLPSTVVTNLADKAIAVKLAAAGGALASVSTSFALATTQAAYELGRLQSGSTDVLSAKLIGTSLVAAEAQNTILIEVFRDLRDTLVDLGPIDSSLRATLEGSKLSTEQLEQISIQLSGAKEFFALMNAQVALIETGTNYLEERIPNGSLWDNFKTVVSNLANASTLGNPINDASFNWDSLTEAAQLTQDTIDALGDSATWQDYVSLTLAEMFESNQFLSGDNAEAIETLRSVQGLTLAGDLAEALENARDQIFTTDNLSAGIEFFSEDMLSDYRLIAPDVDVLIDVGSPDLVARGVTVSGTSAEPRDTFKLDYEVENIGDAYTGTTLTGIFLSNDPDIDPADDELLSSYITQLDASETEVVTGREIPLPDDLSNGDYWVGAVADYDDRVTEGNESNNASNGAPITIGEAATPPEDTGPKLEPIGDTSIDENTTGPILAVSITHPQGYPVSYGLDGDDANAFEINPETGVVKPVVSLDFETPVDTNSDNEYELNVIATDSNEESDASDFIITIEDLNEAPKLTMEDLSFDAIAGLISADFSVVDPENDNVMIETKLLNAGDASNVSLGGYALEEGETILLSPSALTEGVSLSGVHAGNTPSFGFRADDGELKSEWNFASAYIPWSTSEKDPEISIELLSSSGNEDIFGVFVRPNESVISLDSYLMRLINHDQVSLSMLSVSGGITNETDLDQGIISFGGLFLSELSSVEGDFNEPLARFATTLAPENAPVSVSLSDVVMEGDFGPVDVANPPKSSFGYTFGSRVMENDPENERVTGVLEVIDADLNSARFQDPGRTALEGTWGEFSFDPRTGEWAYTLDNDSEAVRALPSGEEVTDSLTVTSLDGTASETVNVTVEGSGFREPDDTSTPIVNIEGVVFDRSGSELSNSVVTFTPSGADAVSTTTDPDGRFGVEVPQDASGRLSAIRSYDQSTDPAITASDALNALRLAVGLNPGFGEAGAFDFVAADINQDGSVTASDALDILRFAVGLDTPNMPEWVFLDERQDMSGVSSETVDYETGIDIDQLTADASMEMTGVLLGSVQEYA
ncbi:VCBS domain-containing protein [Roseovarius tibetensis]|uniref:VCBS domain-containing protein n=1 Tax=Roseovarius tibetensis TaxID=2685897 RepID=UPI003D7F3A00